MRGPLPAGFFGILDDGLNVTFDRYPGLEIIRRVPCRGHGSDHCPKMFNYAKLMNKIKQGSSQIYCDEAEELVDITTLLLGINPTDRDMKSSELRRYLTDITSSIRQLAEQASVSQRSFMKLQNLFQRTQETRCPSIFTITHSGTTRLGKKTYVLRLYCEEPGAWHPLPANAGRYEITDLPQWLKKAGPHIARTLRILKATTPFIGSVLGLAAEEISRTLQQDIELATNLLSGLPDQLGAFDGPLILATIDDAADPRHQADADADFRIMESMLIDLDPPRVWGGLSRTVTPEGLTLYLCKDHLASYRLGV